ncbi:MAG: SDR family oxidoreductase [Solirubrobacterales bacterium]|nr:SDR family oxidoreductase [Solirubrobacterales bacterium]MBV9808459.1 SDR family oxidoreductase [Solirubrobacterales bacterium]
MILVIGGRSKIGSALIENLVERGEPVRALSRAHESARPFPAGVESVVGDLGDVESLNAAMVGVKKVFLLCGPTPDEVAFNKNAIDAAAAHGIELLVRSSILGADGESPATFVRDHGMCDEYLRSAGLGFAIVRPNMFMQNIPENTMPSIEESGNFYTNTGNARISMVDTRDVAAAAAVLLTEPGHQGEEVDVTGPEAFGYDDVAVKLSAAMGRPVAHVAVPDDAVRSALAGFGLGDWMVEGLVGLFRDYRQSGTDGYAAQVTDTVSRCTGRDPRSLDGLLAEVQPAGASR